MKTQLILAIVAAAAIPVVGFAADDQTTQSTELDKLVTEMNTAPAEQKLDAIVSLLNKLVELCKAAKEQTQETAAFNENQGMSMCCDMMKGDENQSSH
jgi:hypothetical protein